MRASLVDVVRELLRAAREADENEARSLNQAAHMTAWAAGVTIEDGEVRGAPEPPEDERAAIDAETVRRAEELAARTGREAASFFAIVRPHVEHEAQLARALAASEERCKNLDAMVTMRGDALVRLQPTCDDPDCENCAHDVTDARNGRPHAPTCPTAAERAATLANGGAVPDGGIGRLSVIWLYKAEGALRAYRETLPESDRCPLDELIKRVAQASREAPCETCGEPLGEPPWCITKGAAVIHGSCPSPAPPSPLPSMGERLALTREEHDLFERGVQAGREAERRAYPTAWRTLRALRADGWVVAVHNDYRLNGRAHTFWLFTKDGRAIKGEARTDGEALAKVAFDAGVRWNDADDYPSEACSTEGKPTAADIGAPAATTETGST